MKFQIERRELLNAVTKAAAAVERRNTIPILGFLRIEAANDTVKITATNMDMEVSVTAPATVDQPGKITAPADLLAGIVKKIPDGALISMDAPNADLFIKAGRSRFTLPTLPAADFPVMASAEYQATVETTGAALMRLIGGAKFAMSREETRYYLNGVYLHNQGETIRAVATDGHRFAQIDGDITCEIPGVIVPRRCVEDIMKLFKDAADLVVSISETKIRIETDGLTLVSKTIEGTFPDYRRIVPTQWKDTLRVDAASLAAAVDRVMLTNDAKAKAVKLEVAPEGLRITSGSGSASGEDVIDADWTGGEFAIGFNGAYLVELMAQIDGAAELRVTGAGDPVVIVGDGDSSAVMLCMPMRVV